MSNDKKILVSFPRKESRCEIIVYQDGTLEIIKHVVVTARWEIVDEGIKLYDNHFHPDEVVIWSKDDDVHVPLCLGIIDAVLSLELEKNMLE